MYVFCTFMLRFGLRSTDFSRNCVDDFGVFYQSVQGMLYVSCELKQICIYACDMKPCGIL